MVDPRVGIFLEPLNSHDRLFLSYTNLYLATYFIIFVDDVTEVMTRTVQIDLKQLINSILNNKQMVILAKWILENNLSDTVT